MTEFDYGKMAGAGFEGFEIGHRNRALFLIEGERDLEAQLLAIRGALERNRKAEVEVSKKIKELDENIRTRSGDSVEYQMYTEDRWVDAVHDSMFQDAAHSMAAVGMLAPFVESLFVLIFRGLRTRNQTITPDNKRPTADQDLFWNPRVAFRKNEPAEDLVQGISQLARSVGLAEFLPDGYLQTLSALFGYRNNMFHNGFEWPPEIRQKFADRIKNDNWPGNWFGQATRNDEPWIFYMSDEFIAHCLKTVDEVLEGVGRYLERDAGEQD